MICIILASQSPQRRQLLAGLGIFFNVIPSTVRESDIVEHDPIRRAELLAVMKAREVARRNSKAVVIGCDTLVVSATGELLEKPVDESDAERMLLLHSGQTSLVHSGIAVIADGKEFSAVSTSSVTFKRLSEEEVRWWITSGMWKDRSGGFQIDGKGQLMIERIEGDWTSIVGLPVYLLGELLRKAGRNEVLF